MHTAKLRLRVEPMPHGRAAWSSARCSTTACRATCSTVVLEELENAGQGGGVLGFPLDAGQGHAAVAAQMHETESTEIAFRMAAAAGVRRRACATPARCCWSRS